MKQPKLDNKDYIHSFFLCLIFSYFICLYIFFKFWVKNPSGVLTLFVSVFIIK